MQLSRYHHRFPLIPPQQAEELNRKSMMLRTPRDGSSGRRRRRGGQELHCDYLHHRQKTTNRRRIDPLITFSTILEGILNEMRDMPDVQPFLFPVNAKVSQAAAVGGRRGGRGGGRWGRVEGETV